MTCMARTSNGIVSRIRLNVACVKDTVFSLHYGRVGFELSRAAKRYILWHFHNGNISLSWFGTHTSWAFAITKPSYTIPWVFKVLNNNRSAKYGAKHYRKAYISYQVTQRLAPCTHIRNTIPERELSERPTSASRASAHLCDYTQELLFFSNQICFHTNA